MNKMDDSNKSPAGGSSESGAANHAPAQPLSILVAGRAEATVNSVVARLAKEPHLSVSARKITNGHADPLHNVEAYPDALVFVLSGGWEDELQSLAARPAKARPPSLIIALEENPRAMRLAMRAGAREFLKWPEQLEEMKSALALIAGECQGENQTTHASITSIMNAKGGSGGSFIASSLAHVLASRDNLSTALLDLDLQFSGLTGYFDLHIKHGLVEVLEAVPEMDKLALAGYMTPHESGLDLLGNKEGMVGLSEEVEPGHFITLLDLLSLSYERVVIDLPRHLDYMTIQALECSDRIAIVVQQNVSSLKDAIRLLAIFRNELSISKNKLAIIINRFDKNSEISAQDIQNTLCLDSVMTIANDFNTVTESLNTGVPVYTSARGSKVTKSILKVSDTLEGRTSEQQGSLISHAVTGLRHMLDARNNKN